MVIYNELWHPHESLFYYDTISRVKLDKPHDFVLISKLHSYNGTYTDPWPGLKQTLIQNNKPVVMFLCGDEHYEIGNEYYIEGITTLIFKQYTYYLNTHPSIRPIPLGLLNAYKDYLPLPIHQRVYDYSFTGICHESRYKLREQLEHKQDNYLKFVQFYEGWIDASNRIQYWDRYQQILQSTKLSLCPAGPRSSETFRTIESARCGSIIVSTEMIDHWYNKHSPYVKVNNWEDLSIIDQLLSKTEKELQELSTETYNWYQNYLSPQAIANYVTQEVNNVL